MSAQAKKSRKALPERQLSAQTGVLLYVMGPSGAGKDSLLQFAGRHFSGQEPPSESGGENTPPKRPVRFVQRYITRPSGSGGEDHHGLSEGEFERRRRRGEFCMHWRSHGLYYGIGLELETWLRDGCLAVLNGSRAYLPEAEARFPQLTPLVLHVEPSVLRARLLQRGRETPEEIEERLSRNQLETVSAKPLLYLDNSGDLQVAQQAFCGILERLRG